MNTVWSCCYLLDQKRSSNTSLQRKQIKHLITSNGTEETTASAHSPRRTVCKPLLYLTQGSAHTIAHVSAPAIAPIRGPDKKPTTAILQGWNIWHTSECLRPKGNGRGHEVTCSWFDIISFFIFLFFRMVLRQVPYHIYCCTSPYRIFFYALLLFAITVLK